MPSELDAFLGEHCSLTKRQMEVLSLQIDAQNTIRDGSKTERPHITSGVAEGSYYRVLSQARQNIDQALYTMLLCSRMGILQGEDLNRLLKLISRAPSELPGDPKEVISLVDALVRKIVML